MLGGRTQNTLVCDIFSCKRESVCVCISWRDKKGWGRGRRRVTVSCRKSTLSRKQRKMKGPAILTRGSVMFAVCAPTDRGSVFCGAGTGAADIHHAKRNNKKERKKGTAAAG